MSIQDLKFRCYFELFVGDSTISGKGLFTKNYITKGDTVMTFGGILARVEDRYSGNYLSSTFSGVSEGIMICEDKSSKKDYSDFLNHSCDPNVGMDDCLTIVATRDIQPGEELTIDYAFFEADENWILKIDCNCGAKNCRKTITGADWRKVNSKDRMFSYYAPFIKRRILKNELGSFGGTEEKMSDLFRYTMVDYGVPFLSGKWLLNVYTIKSDPKENINIDVKKELIEKHLLLLEKKCMSVEFDYYKTGFVFLHFGNRGVDLTIWHVGRWGSTFETFVCSWYCYGRDIWNMEQLDSAEPILCQYEMKLLTSEINNITSLIECKTVEEFRKKYFKERPRKSLCNPQHMTV